MKARLKFIVRLSVASLVTLSAARTSAFVYENARELTAEGDFDGDGRLDLVIVDRASGNYRLGYQLAPGVFTWVADRASGISNVTGLAIGKLNVTTRDALAFTSPDANRVNLLDATSPSSAGLPVSVFIPSVGPNMVGAIDIGGVGNTAHDDLYVCSRYNPGHRETLVRNDGVNRSAISDTAISTLRDRANLVVLKVGALPRLGLFARNTGVNTDAFQVYNFATGAPVQTFSLTGLNTPAPMEFVAGKFSPTNVLSQILFYRPTQDHFSRYQVQEPVPGTFTLPSGTQFNLGTPIAQIFVLTGAAEPRLLVIFGTGGSASVYNFNGVDAPVLVQSFVAPAGEFLSGAATLANDSFLLYSAPLGATSSTKFHTHNFTGSNYVAGTSGNLVALNALAGSGNVFAFQYEPFVKPLPNLLRTLNAGDWSSGFTLVPGPLVDVTVENFVNSGQGLDNPSVTSLGAAHPMTAFGLVNQYLAPISLFGFTPPVGDEIVDVKISPPPGRYAAGVQITLTPALAFPPVEIYFRPHPTDAWTLYAGPFPLFKNTTVSYYAKPVASNSKSTVRHAAYEFVEGPDALDTDKDGVPDYVEIAKGTDPSSGSDHDHDGFTDLDELLNGFDPNSAASVPPSNHTRLELQAVFDLAATLRPWDGIANAASLSRTGALAHAYDLNGSLLAFGQTHSNNIAGIADPSVVLSNIVISTEQPLVLAATEPHFDIYSGGADSRVGREVITMFPSGDVRPPVIIGYLYGNGPLTTEASNWVASASNAYHNIEREIVSGDAGIYHTLVALLVEQKIQEILLSRGFASFSNITLFPFRPTDAARLNPSLPELLALEARVDDTMPGFRLRMIWEHFHNALTPAGPGPVPELKAVTAEIYRLSSSSNNASPGTYPPPVDTLRDFLHTGVLHSNYLAHTAMTGGQLTTAFTGAATLRSNVMSRPVTNIVLKVRPDSFTGPCTLLNTPDLLATWSLFHAGPVQFRLLESFQLLVGTEVTVFGYSDITNNGCGGIPVEVISLTLGAVPAVTPVDTDGDLLLDALEQALFGDLDESAYGDADGDGIKNLQEFLDGTDATDDSSAMPFVDLSPPLVTMEIMGGGQIKLSFTWSAAYANKINFGVFATSTLGGSFGNQLISAVHLGGGNFAVVLPAPGSAIQFYRLHLSLK